MSNSAENAITLPTEIDIISKAKENPFPVSFLASINDLLFKISAAKELPAKSGTFLDKSLPHLLDAVLNTSSSDESFLNAAKIYIDNYINLISKDNFNYNMIQSIQRIFPQYTDENQRIINDNGVKIEDLFSFDDQSLYVNSRYEDLSFLQQYLFCQLFKSGFMERIYTAGKEEVLLIHTVRSYATLLLTLVDFMNDGASYVLLRETSGAIFTVISKTPDQFTEYFISYFKSLMGLVPDMMKEICDAVCETTVKSTNGNSKTKLVQLMLEMPIQASPDNLKNGFIEVLTQRVVNNPKYTKSIVAFFPKLIGVSKIDIQDVLKLLSNGFMAKRQYCKLAITLLESYDGPVDEIANFCISSEEYSAQLIAYIISRIDKDTACSNALFAKLVSTQKKISKTEMSGILFSDNLKYKFEHVFDDINNVELIENVSHFYVNASYIESIKDHLEMLARASIVNTELLPCLDMFSSTFHDIDCSNILQDLLEFIANALISQHQNIPVEFSLIISHWIKESEKIDYVKLINIFSQLDFSNVPQGIIILVDAILRKAAPSDEIDKFAIKLAVDTVPKRLARWAINLIFDTLHKNKNAVKEICNILVGHLSNSDRFDNAVRMILEGVKYEADFYELTNKLNVPVFFRICDKRRDILVTLHPFNSTRRIYFEVSRQLCLPINEFDLEVEENDDFVPLIYNNPLSRLNLTKKQKINLRVVESSGQCQREVIESVFISFLKEIGMQQIFECLTDVNDSTSCLFQVLTLIFQYIKKTNVSSDMQKILFSFPCNVESFIGANKILPYALQSCRNIKIQPALAQKIAEYITDGSFDPISIIIMSKSFPTMVQNLEFTPDLVRKGLIESRNETLSEMFCLMVNAKTPNGPFIKCMNYATMNQNRAHTFYFFEAMKKLSLPASFYEPFFRDLQQYEDSHYIDPDQTFIQMLKLIPVTQETIRLVIQRLFENPTVKNPIAPFVITKEAREAAFKFLQNNEADKQILAQLNKIHPVPPSNLKISDDLTYRGRTGLYNIQATCYINSVLQCINALPNFSANLLSLSGDSLTPFVTQLRNIIANLRYSVDDAISVCNFAETLINFSQGIQEDTAEFFNQSIVDRLRTELGQSNAITNEIRGELENRFISKDDGKIYATNKSEFFHIILPIQGFSTIDEAFNQFFKGYEVEYTVSEDQKVKVMNVPVITKWPNCLVIQLERYEYLEFERIKLIHEVAFPYALDPNRIAADSGSEPCDVGYELVAVIVHEGEVDSGHYISIVQGDDGEWYLCNDSTIEYFDVVKMKSWTFGMSENDSGIREKVWTGYMLFYKRKDIVPVKAELPVEIEEKINAENASKWPSFVLSSNLFLNYALERIRSAPSNPNVIEIATLSLLRIAAANEEILSKWCTIMKQVIQKKDNCSVFFQVIKKHLTNSLGGIISISDTTENLLEKLFGTGLKVLNKSIEPLTILLTCLEKSTSKRSGQFMLNLLIECFDYPYKWDSEDDALLQIASYITNFPLEFNFRTLLPRYHPIALEKFMKPISHVLSVRGIIPAIYTLFSIESINKITSSVKKSQAFNDVLQKIALLRPEMYNNQKYANQQTKLILGQIKIPESSQEEPQEVPHVDVSPLWDSLSKLMFSSSQNSRNSACALIKSRVKTLGADERNFFKGGFVEEDAQKPDVNEESSLIHFTFGLIPTCVEMIKEDIGRSVNFIRLLVYLSQMFPITLSPVLYPLINILPEIEDGSVSLMIINLIVNVTAIKPNFINSIDNGIIEYILSSSFVGRIPVLFIIECGEKASKSQLLTKNINYFLSEQSDDACLILSKYCSEFGVPDFDVPEESCGFEQLSLSIVLWDKCENKREELSAYMLDCIRGIKDCPPLVKTDTVKQALQKAAETAPETAEALLEEFKSIPWFSNQ